MAYLENKRLIHRDLAARNILVFAKDKVCRFWIVGRENKKLHGVELNNVLTFVIWVFLFFNLQVKVSDFGLSRALGVGKDYYQTNFNVNLKLPIAWLVYLHHITQTTYNIEI